MLYHLRRKRIIGAKHTHYDNIKFRFPSNIGKEIEDIEKEFIKQNYIITKPTSYGLQISLNKEKLKEIEDFIKKVLGHEF